MLIITELAWNLDWLYSEVLTSLLRLEQYK